MADSAPGEFGPLLRQAREKRGLSLQQVAATTKISARVLDALERNDPSKLPGGIFSRAFVRAYAREVGLDPEETVNQFVAAFSLVSEETAPVAAARAVDAEGFESGRRTAMTLVQIVGLSVLVVIIAVVYMKLRPAPPTPVEPPASSVPAPRTPPPPVSAPAADPAAAEPLASPTTDAGAGQTPALPVAATTAPAVPAADPSFAPTADAPLAVSILANEECWLSLTVDGTRVLARTLQPGERVQYRARTNAIVSAGNAGGLTMTLNGKPARSLGRTGEVVTVTITPGSARTFLQ